MDPTPMAIVVDLVMAIMVAMAIAVVLAIMVDMVGLAITADLLIAAVN